MNTLLLMALLSTNHMELRWESIPNAHYRVMAATSLREPVVWTTLTNVLGTGETMQVKVPIVSPQRFFSLIMRTNPLAGNTLYVETNTPASRQVAIWRPTRPADADLLQRKIANQSTTIWINSDTDVVKIPATFAKCGTNLPTFCLYNIYLRDYQGGHSAGGVKTPALYTNFINSCALAIGNKKCIVVLEPDTLAALDGLPPADQETRFQLMTYAVDRLSLLPNVYLYVDGAHPHWIQDPAIMAARLKRVGVHKTSGFSLNVSNFIATDECVRYGTNISRLLDYIHFIVDTSRNGRGPTPDYQWCNPPGRGLGFMPTTVTGNFLVDGYLWIKYPGESDGACNGSNYAGEWLPDYALMLCQNAIF